MSEIGFHLITSRLCFNQNLIQINEPELNLNVFTCQFNIQCCSVSVRSETRHIVLDVGLHYALSCQWFLQLIDYFYSLLTIKQ